MGPGGFSLSRSTLSKSTFTRSTLKRSIFPRSTNTPEIQYVWGLAGAYRAHSSIDNDTLCRYTRITYYRLT